MVGPDNLAWWIIVRPSSVGCCQVSGGVFLVVSRPKLIANQARTARGETQMADTLKHVAFVILTLKLVSSSRVRLTRGHGEGHVRETVPIKFLVQ